MISVRQVLFCFAFMACDHSGVAHADTHHEKSKPARQELIRQKKWHHIQKMIKNLSCESIEDCSSIGVGATPCGGPQSYLIYARAYVNEEELRKRVEQYNKAASQFVVKSGLVGICVMKEAPLLVCYQKQCRASF